MVGNAKEYTTEIYRGDQITGYIVRSGGWGTEVNHMIVSDRRAVEPNATFLSDGGFRIVWIMENK